MKRLLLLLATGMLAVGFSACSDDAASDNGGADPDPMPGVDPNPGMDPEPGMNPDPNPGPGPGVDPNPDPSPEGDPCANIDCQEGTPEDYDYSTQGSFFSEIILVLDPEDGEDLNGDGSPNNALGGLLNDLGGLLGDVDINAQLAESIANGSLLLGAKWPNGSAGADVSIHFLALEGTPPNGPFLATRSSFVAGTQTPAIQFNGASVEGGTLAAGPADFSITLPLGGIALSLVVSDAQIKGDVSDDGDGVAVNNGRIAGSVSLESIVAALNGFLQSDNCSCLGLTGPLIDLSAGVGPQACSMDFDDSTCADADQDICSTIAGACILAVPVIAGQTDIDLSGDGSPDAISVAIDLSLTGAVISGPAAE